MLVGPLLSECWTIQHDVHGPGGTPHKVETVGECKAVCINDAQCVAVDWEAGNARGETCRTFTSTAVENTTQSGRVVHYVIDRRCVG